MAMSKERLQELAGIMAGRVEQIRPRARLQVVRPQARSFDGITRDSVLQRIRDLQRMYRLGWLVRQETFDRPGVDALEDDELSALLRKMEHARECISDGVSFEDAGLIRDMSGEMP